MPRRTPAEYPFRCAQCGTVHTLRVLSPSPRRARIETCRKCKVPRRLLPPGGIASTLTHREQVVLDLTGQGLAVSEIATMIGVGRVRVYQLQRAALAKQAAGKFAGRDAAA